MLLVFLWGIWRGCEVALDGDEALLGLGRHGGFEGGVDELSKSG